MDKERAREQVMAKERLEENQFEWDPAVLKSYLPLMPDQSISIPITIFGHVGWYAYREAANRRSFILFTGTVVLMN